MTRPPATSGATSAQAVGDVLVGQAVEAVAADALVVERARAGRSSRRARGWPRWKAVSKQATCGTSGSIAMASRIGARLFGWCSGASVLVARRAASRTASSIRTGLVEVRAAVHDAVADGDEARALRASRSQARGRRDRGRQVGDLGRLEVAVDQRRAVARRRRAGAGGRRCRRSGRAPGARAPPSDARRSGTSGSTSRR